MSLSFLLPAIALATTPGAQAQPVVAAPPPERVAAEPAPVAPAAFAPAELSDPLTDPASPEAAAAPPALVARHNKGDPLEGFNRAMFGIYMKLDKAVYRPAAMGHKKIVPKPIRSGLRNFFTNLSEPIAFLNYVLQLKIGKAAETFARFGINSTLGLGGMFDIAKREDFKLPHRDNGFGNTLARYGVGPGPFVFLPFLGPTTLRDLAGAPLDGAVLPVAVGVPFNRIEYQVSTGVLRALDQRAEADPDLRALFAGAVDPYATLRSVWLQRRAAEVAEIRAHRHRKKGGAPELTDPLADPAAGTTPAGSGAAELQDPLADPAAPSPEPASPRP